jgi:hypothetical protein
MDSFYNLQPSLWAFHIISSTGHTASRISPLLCMHAHIQVLDYECALQLRVTSKVIGEEGLLEAYSNTKWKALECFMSSVKTWWAHGTKQNMLGSKKWHNVNFLPKFYEAATSIYYLEGSLFLFMGIQLQMFIENYISIKTLIARLLASGTKKPMYVLDETNIKIQIITITN